jgi:predicted amidohydrolase
MRLTVATCQFPVSDDIAPGSHFATFVINGVRCGAQICHDYRYPELHRQYQRRGVRLMFQPFHAACSSRPPVTGADDPVTGSGWLDAASMVER